MRKFILRFRNLTGLILISLCVQPAFSQPVYPGKNIGKSEINLTGTSFTLENNSLKSAWDIKNHQLRPVTFQNSETGDILEWGESPWFSIELQNGKRLTSRDFVLTGKPAISEIQGDPASVKRSDHFQGQKIVAELRNPALDLNLQLEISIKDSSNYIRQKFTLSSNNLPEVSRISLIEVPLKAGFEPGGKVAGSPLVNHDIFLAVENPNSLIDTSGQALSVFLAGYRSNTSSNPLTCTSVWGVTPGHQLRRGFLYYLERERVVPYRQMLHYNSWFDISWPGVVMNEAICEDRIRTYGDSLFIRRGVPVNAFLFDDGWDDHRTLWEVNKQDFPHGFSDLAALTKKYNSALGIWMSPWGGYGEAKEQRLEYGKTQKPPFEINENGFSLSGPVYYKRFFNVAADFVKHDRVIMFKYDGVGAGNNKKGAGSEYASDINALLKLVTDLRTVKPDLYFSLTTGTWASPFWLFYGDNIWRNGGDTGLKGSGTKRQQWITYRDAETYKNIVGMGPLYPLNALMIHGICIADNGQPATFDLEEKDINDEIWSFFATGTSLQELYINPHKLTPAEWNTLAEAIRWSRKNKKTLVDVHWVGGDPGKGDVYGWAAWSPENSIITLRNPTAGIKTFHVDVVKDLELPGTRADELSFYTVDQSSGKISGLAGTGREFEVTLQPFEVKIMETSDVK